MFKLLATMVAVICLSSCQPKPSVSDAPASPTQSESSRSVVIGDQTIMVPKTLTLTQNQLLNTAFAFAKADGHENPALVQGVLLQESKAGALKSFKVAGPANDKYYGLMQIKVGSAREVMRTFPKLWTKYKFHTKTDDELKANLILNEPFNIEVGSKYLKILHQRYGFSGRELMNAYNRGPGGVKSVNSDEFYYAIDAEKKLAAVKRRS